MEEDNDEFVGQYGESILSNMMLSSHIVEQHDELVPISDFGEDNSQNQLHLQPKLLLVEPSDDEGLIDGDVLGVKPTIGMVFDTVEEAGAFYNIYGRSIGFSVRINSTHRSHKKDRRILKREFVCSHEGFRRRHSRLVTPILPRPKTRCGCKACFFVKFDSKGKYVVIEFLEEHNHDLVKQREVHMLNSQRNISTPQASLISGMYKSGIQPRKMHSFLSNQAGGSHNLTLTRKDCNNFVQRERSKYLKRGDSQTVMDYFVKLQISHPDFFYMVHLDDDGQLASCFWCDGHSRKDYEIFSDVICFDTTFKTNGYSLPYAPFVGVNHHGQSILFGCGLLFNETTESFVWLFRAFLVAMNDKHPQTIFTDQAQAISNAIELVFPKSHHGLCLWHIYQNAAKHLSHIFQGDHAFSSDFTSCVYHNETEEQFEASWKKLVVTYGLENNEWMLKLYSLRHKWALVFGRQYFCGGITTTQRSESMNSYFKKYFKRTYLLHEFVQRYDEALSDRREAEIIEDYNSRRSIPHLRAHWHIEKEASQFYPRQIFSRFQAEYLRCLDLYVECDGEHNGLFTYRVSGYNDNHYRTVVYNKAENALDCSCKGFEFTGLMCAHGLKVLHHNRVSSMNPCYFISRWGKDATAGHTMLDRGIKSLDVNNLNFTERYSKLAHFALEFAMKAATTQKSAKLGMDEMINSMKKLELCVASTCSNKEDSAEVGQGEENTSSLIVKDPPRKKDNVRSYVKTRGGLQQGTRLTRTRKTQGNKKVKTSGSTGGAGCSNLNSTSRKSSQSTTAPGHSHSFSTPSKRSSQPTTSIGDSHSFSNPSQRSSQPTTSIGASHGFSTPSQRSSQPTTSIGASHGFSNPSQISSQANVGIGSFEGFLNPLLVNQVNIPSSFNPCIPRQGYFVNLLLEQCSPNFPSQQTVEDENNSHQTTRDL